MGCDSGGTRRALGSVPPGAPHHLPSPVRPWLSLAIFSSPFFIYFFRQPHPAALPWERSSSPGCLDAAPQEPGTWAGCDPGTHGCPHREHQLRPTAPPDPPPQPLPKSVPSSISPGDAARWQLVVPAHGCPPKVVQKSPSAAQGSLQPAPSHFWGLAPV